MVGGINYYSKKEYSKLSEFVNFLKLDNDIRTIRNLDGLDRVQTLDEYFRMATSITDDASDPRIKQIEGLIEKFKSTYPDDE